MSDIGTDETYSYSEEEMDVEPHEADDSMETAVAISAILDESENLENEAEQVEEKSNGKHKVPRKKKPQTTRDERELWKTLAKIQEDLFSLKRSKSQDMDENENAPKRAKIDVSTEGSAYDRATCSKSLKDSENISAKY